MRIKKRVLNLDDEEIEESPKKKNYDLEELDEDYSDKELIETDQPYYDNNQLFNEDLNDGFFGDGGYSPPMQKHNDLLKELTNFAPFLKATLNNWIGVHWDETQEKYVPNINVKPIMNINGATWCIGRLQIYARPNNIITDISSQDYNFINQDIIEEMWINLGTRADEFGIKDEGDILRVANEMIHASNLVLMGAGDGRYNKFLGTTITRHENVNPQIQDFNNYNLPKPVKKNGFMARLGKMFTGM